MPIPGAPREHMTYAPDNELQNNVLDWLLEAGPSESSWFSAPRNIAASGPGRIPDSEQIRLPDGRWNDEIGA
jgi:hypothetical protein